MKRILLILLLVAAPVAAQPPIRGGRGPLPGRPELRIAEDATAGETMQRLQETLRQYPPSVAHVLALDPTLLTNDAYLQPYSQLAALMTQHPEIAHNPAYFFDPQLRELSRRNGDW